MSPDAGGRNAAVTADPSLDQAALRQRLVRCLDGAFYSLLLALLLVVFRRFTPVPWLEPPLYLIPATGMALAAFCFPGEEVLPPVIAMRLKTTALGFAGLAPFIFWWLRTPQNPYLTVVANLALLTGGGLLLQMTTALRILFVRCRAARLALLATWVRELFFYAVILPMLVLDGLFLYAWVGLPQFDLESYPLLWLALPAGLRVVMILPFAGLAAALGAGRRLAALHSGPLSQTAGRTAGVCQSPVPKAGPGTRQE